MKLEVGGVGPLLAGMVAKGLVTLEQLDQPLPRWQAELPMMTQCRLARGLPPPVWRNPAREWVEANPKEWVALQNLHAEVRSHREQYRSSASGLGWPGDATEKLSDVPAEPVRGWVDSSELVEFEP